MKPLNDREDLLYGESVALVTGGTGGIGRAIVHRLKEAGALVVIADVDGVAGGELAHEVEGIFVHCDVTEFDAVKAAVSVAAAEADKMSRRFDIVSHNAGIAGDAGIGADYNPAELKRLMMVNFLGTANSINAALPALQGSNGGRIIATASIAGLDPTVVAWGYSASKSAAIAAVEGMATLLNNQKSRGAEQGSKEVLLHALCPGFVNTPQIDPLRELLSSNNVPVLEPEDVADGFMQILLSKEPGKAWPLLPGEPLVAHEFADVEGFWKKYRALNSLQRRSTRQPKKSLSRRLWQPNRTSPVNIRHNPRGGLFRGR